MSRFLDTLGNSNLAIFICDRCKMKRAHSTARPDPNFPGLLVCNEGCADEKDPYRLAPRPTERITIRFPRPDVSVVDTSSALLTATDSGEVIATEQNNSNPSNNGNISGLEA
tara:strand:+ start:230 stop:565 length:336 start_codon:yes stop_codon:yes gene_type:complete